MPPNNRPIKLEITIAAEHPQLLHGLELWLQLGLISDTQVRKLCREFLVCPVAIQPQPIPEPVEALPAAPPPLISVPSTPKQPNILVRMLQSLGAELSVRWLLFLGMFLVVVSSGVLAASQWQKFPPPGQYGVLLAYTLSFWGVSFWASRQPNLLLTARALLLVTLLLVPINFWAMDSFQLWQNPLNWLVIAIASIILTTLTVIVYNHRLFVGNKTSAKLLLANILGLSYLHWGWRLPQFPLIAIYLATIGTTLITTYHTLHQPRGATPETRESKWSTSIPPGVIVYALAVLLVRAIFVVQVDIQKLGLAIGICGWLVAWLSQYLSPRSSPQVEGENQPTVNVPPTLLPWELIGGILLFLGWLVSVTQTVPWQATAVSILGLWFFYRRLQRQGFRTDVLAIFVVGLQTIWQVWRLVPDDIQASVILILGQLTNSLDTPWGLWSIALFPYVIFMLALVEGLYRNRKLHLADFGERLTLFFGVCLTLISLASPTLRSLNLVLSTITLATVTHKRSPSRISLIYFTQLTGVLTLCSIINSFLPNLSTGVWASILLAVGIGELLFSLGHGVWQRSGWNIGLGLVSLSYYLLWVNVAPAWNGFGDSRAMWGLVWLFTPITLTAMAHLGHHNQMRVMTSPTIISWLSVATLIFAQFLTLPLSGSRLVGLAVAAILMWFNTYHLRYLQTAMLSVGYGLGLIAALLWEGIPGFLRLSLQGWFLVTAVVISGLWFVCKFLRRREQELVAIYAEANDRWAIALTVFELLALSLHSTLVYQGLAEPGVFYIVSTAIVLGAIGYRSWGQPTNWSFYGIAWALELLVAQIISFSDRSLIKIAIANIALGLITQLLGEWWRRRHQLENLPNRWHILPLLYAFFGAALRWQAFADWTGLSSLAVALIMIGVGRRQRELKPLVYIGLFGVSISVYELLLYQLLQVPGGAVGDGLIAMAGLGTGIMYAYRVLSPWLLNYLQLSSEELKVVSHVHWAVSSCLLLYAPFTPVDINRFVGLGIGVSLIGYAIFQGRMTQSARQAEAWVYLGLLEVAGMRFYWSQTAIAKLFAGPLQPWSAPLAAVVAYFLYILPWERWGWSKRPWHYAAYILPLIYLWESRNYINSVGLLITASFYVFLALMSRQFRFTYISVALIDWAIFLWFSSFQITDSLWYVTIIGLSLLYVAQFDPRLQQRDMKPSRHVLRLLSSGAICGWAVIFHQHMPLIPGIFSLMSIFAGLSLRIRAFLYIGAIAFFITSFYQLVILILEYAFLKWVVGLFVGIILIVIAANFETHREQLNSLIRNASEELQQWE